MYRYSLISFIDILGFKDLIDNENYETVSEKLAAVKHFNATLGNDVDGEGWEPRVIQFSDSIIRIRPLDGKKNIEFAPGILFNELLDLVHLQAELVKHGVCLRGGIAIGDAHYDDRTVFGPGFVRAYEMESQFASVPRIVVDPEVLQALMSDPRLIAKDHSLAHDAEFIRKLVRKDADGLFFVDYLNAIVDELDKPELEPVFLQQHKELVLKGLGRGDKLNRLTAKYLWLANYHNESVRRRSPDWFEAYDLTLADLEVSQDELPCSFDWPDTNQ